MFINSVVQNGSYVDEIGMNCSALGNCTQYKDPTTGLYSIDSDLYLPQSFSLEDTAALITVVILILLMVVVKIIARSCGLNGMSLNLRAWTPASAHNNSEDVTGPGRLELLALNSTKNTDIV